ncbi:MAG: deoxyguanosinetriphosphate triphosphohydrolase [Meiothermus sp.]|nr:deoxyguanosinetriphosphate triphosphohydrolase [Meiothermus sp.]
MLFEREQLEALEANLAPYAARSAHSGGRAYPEGESRFRTAFQKDRDRINHTTAFRRLQYKTQVFVNYEGDYYRTRLTHTLEVAQVARSVARALGLHQELSETVAFAHDLGHPPFGHSGERVLDRLMRHQGGFDHNKQSLRIVTHLEQRYPGFRGLNLTWLSLEGMVKHEPKFNPADAAGYDPDQRPSLEAQVVNLADETAYYAHDIDDGLRSSVLRPGQLAEVGLLGDLMAELGLKPDSFDAVSRLTLVRELLGLIITDTITSTHALLERNKVGSLEAVRRHPVTLAQYSPELGQKLQELRRFLYTNLYRHPYIMQQRDKTEAVLVKLFEIYCKSPDLLPSGVRHSFEEEGLERSVCDYIAGMTDRYALEEYERLFGEEM